MNVIVNGEPRQVREGTTVADLVRQLGLKAEQVAVEQNKRLVQRSDHATTALADGDRLEIVTFLGGG